MRLTPSLLLLPLLLAPAACRTTRYDRNTASTTAAVADEVTGPCGLQADGSRAFPILHIQDVYRIQGLADGRGGLSRVRTLRRELEEGCGPVLLTHGGDMLGPSLLSRSYRGAQMIDVLSLLDGVADQDDPYMVAVFGNHEFDRARLEHAPELQGLLDDAGFPFLDTNISWARGAEGEPLIGGDNLHHSLMFDLHGVQVGVFGLTIDTKMAAYIESFDTRYEDIARQQTTQLRAAGAEVVVGLTHLNNTDDQALLAALGADGPDLIVGGHDHVQSESLVDGRWVLKADADALSAKVVWVSVAEDGAISVHHESPELGPAGPEYDPFVRAAVDGWTGRFAEEFCGGQGLPVDCLDTPLTHAAVDLIAEELEIRRYETNLGSWVADQALAAFAEHDADIAFLNAGGLRLNQNIGQGAGITPRVVEGLFAYPSPMHLIEIDGATLQRVIERAASDWAGSGHWLQIAGFAWTHDVETGEVGNLTLLGPDGPTPIAPEDTLRAVTVNYLVNPEIGNQDGYQFLTPDMIQPVAADGTDLKVLVRDLLAELGDSGLSIELGGRICSSDRPELPCLAIVD